MEVVGKVKVKNADIQVSATFVKSELVVTTDETYPQHIMIEFGGDKSDLVDPIKVGDTVKVSINLRGREWINPQGEAKYFNSIHGWRIEKIKSETRAGDQFLNEERQAADNARADTFQEEDDNDLPF